MSMLICSSGVTYGIPIEAPSHSLSSASPPFCSEQRTLALTYPSKLPSLSHLFFPPFLCRSPAVHRGCGRVFATTESARMFFSSLCPSSHNKAQRCRGEENSSPGLFFSTAVQRNRIIRGAFPPTLMFHMKYRVPRG